MRAALLLQCPDRPGIVAAVGAFVAETGGNVVEADQHSDPAAGLFLQRVEFDVDASLEALHDGFAAVAERFAMEWSLHDLADRPRVAVLASRQGHCLADLLVRNALGELPGEIVLGRVEPRHARRARRRASTSRSGISPSATTRRRHAAQEQRGSAALLDETAPDVVVLARYMRVLPRGSSTRGSSA